jgi:hypothetical protein
MQLLAAIHDNLPPAKERPDQKAMDPKEMAVGTQFELNGSKFEIVEDEDGNRLLKDGNDYPITPVDAVEKIPVDKGTLTQGEEPAVPEGDFLPPASSAEAEQPVAQTVPESTKPAFYEGGRSQMQSGIFGQGEILDSGVGEQKPLFHQPVDVARPEAERVGSKSATDPNNTAEMFPPKPASSTGETPKPNDGEIRAFGGGAVTKAKQLGAAAINKSTFARQDAAPTLVEATRAIAIREHGADLAQRSDRAEAALDDARKFFDGSTPETNLDFIDRMERGQPHGDPKLDFIAKQLREMLDGRRQRGAALGKGKLQHFIADYFPHIWKDPDKAAGIFGQILGKRPLEGRSLPEAAERSPRRRRASPPGSSRSRTTRSTWRCSRSARWTATSWGSGSSRS